MDQVSREMEKRAKAERGQWGRTLFLFPEGTTTNGTTSESVAAGRPAISDEEEQASQPWPWQAGLTWPWRWVIILVGPVV